MRSIEACLGVVLACCIVMPLPAAEGPSIAGPIGGTDMRSAMLPPPGTYAGGILFGAEAFDFVDGSGHQLPAPGQRRSQANSWRSIVGYVPNLDVLGGSVGTHRVQLFWQAVRPTVCLDLKNVCESGFGDPYFEAAWSRFFGTMRPSRSPGAFPIPQGLSIQAGFGVVIPSGQYDAAARPRAR